MSNLEKICKMLGIEIDVPFQFKENSNIWYKINEQGQILWSDDLSGSSWTVSCNCDALRKLIVGELNVAWIPKKGERYYFPDFCEDNCICNIAWTNNNFDNNIKNRVGIYETREEALKKAKELGWIK